MQTNPPCPIHPRLLPHVTWPSGLDIIPVPGLYAGRAAPAVLMQAILVDTVTVATAAAAAIAVGVQVVVPVLAAPAALAALAAAIAVGVLAAAAVRPAVV